MPASQPTALSATDARRLALRAQGFGGRRPARPTRAHVRTLLDRLGSVQIDAVNVLERAHYLPIFSRLGPYNRAMLDDVVYRRGNGFEYLTHAASVASAQHHALWRWRMEDYAAESWWARSRDAIEARSPGYVDRVVQEVRDHGPLSFKDLADPARRERPKTKYSESSLLWWSKRPSDGKHVLESMWRAGVLAVAGRTSGFERVFDLAERVLPATTFEAATPPRDEAVRALVRHAVSALGVAWVKDVADYHRLKVATARASLRALASDGEIERVAVEGTEGEAYLDPHLRAGRPLRVSALLGPFDSLLWERSRNERLFGFTHSFEIYVPEAKRRYGYYVLPFLLGERFVARVDLKADRRRGALLVQSAHREPEAPAGEVAEALAAELWAMAGWLGLDTIEVARRGDLVKPLRAAVGAAG